MSRRGFGGRGRGRGGGRTGFGGFDFSALGTTYQEVMSQPRDPEEAYPALDVMPSLIDINDHEQRSCKYQHDLVDRLRHSQYYVTEDAKRPDFARYSDRFRPAKHRQLEPTDLDPKFFPPDLWQRCFNPKTSATAATKAEKRKKRKQINLDEIADEGEDENKEDDEDDDDDENEELDDYEDQEDDDYNENYFETGSQDDMYDAGGDDGGGGGDYD